MTTTTMARTTHPTTGSEHTGLSFELTLDNSAYSYSPERPASLTATFVLRNNSKTPLTVTFAGQQFDVAICDADGRQVALWSTGKVFDDLAQTVEITGERRWQATMAVPNPGKGIGAVPFTATAYLTPAGQTGSSPGSVMRPMTVGGGTDGVPIPFPPPSNTVRRWSATVGFSVHADPVILAATTG